MVNDQSLMVNVLHNQCRIGTTKAERVAQEHIKMLLLGFWDDVNALCHFIGMLKIQRSGDEVVLHHHHGVNVDGRSIRNHLLHDDDEERLHRRISEF